MLKHVAIIMDQPKFCDLALTAYSAVLPIENFGGRGEVKKEGI